MDIILDSKDLEQQEFELAPADRTPVNTRDSLIKPPDWRYQEALAFIEAEAKGEMKHIPNDPLVQLVIRVIKASKKPSTREVVRELWPDIYEAIYFGTVAHDSAITAEMEAHIIYGTTMQESEDRIPGVNMKLYALYRDIFFDLTGIRAIHSWIDHYLFEPLRHSGKHRMLRTRMLAYYGGDPVAAANAAVMGGASAGSTDTMRGLIKGERMKRVFDYMTHHTSLSAEQYAEVMESTIKAMSDQEFQEHMRDRTEAGSTTLVEFAEHLEEGIRAYNQQELKSTDPSGLDFTNQYTATILHKENDDGNK